MTSIVATVKVKEDKIEEAKSFFKELAAETLASEPGTLSYVVHQQRDDATAFVVYEKYEDDEAFAIHSKNLASKAGGFGAILAGAPKIVMMDEL